MCIGIITVARGSGRLLCFGRVFYLFFEDIAEIEGLRDVAIATNYINYKWTLAEDNDMRFCIKDGLFSVDPYVC